MVAGLVAITRLAGTAGPMGAMVIGLASGVICFFCATSLKRKLGYDDSLDAFGVRHRRYCRRHPDRRVRCSGSGRLRYRGRHRRPGLDPDRRRAGHRGLHRYRRLRDPQVLDLVMGLRVTEGEETVGLDLSEHNERGYNL